MVTSASLTASSSSPRPTRSSSVPSWPSRSTPTSATSAGGNGSAAQVAPRARHDAPGHQERVPVPPGALAATPISC
eukprot:10331070-Alexandrium_andersonii.AAC.1